MRLRLSLRVLLHPLGLKKTNPWLQCVCECSSSGAEEAAKSELSRWLVSSNDVLRMPMVIQRGSYFAASALWKFTVYVKIVSGDGNEFELMLGTRPLEL
jgi:hypothetical protein